jgi:fructose-bisphosphate aldolase class II
MPLVNPKKMLEKAKQNNQAVGAFNVLNIEIMQGVINAAEEMRVPIICQISQGAMK